MKGREEMKGGRKWECEMGPVTRTGRPEPGPGQTEDKGENGNGNSKRWVRKADYELK